MEIPDEDLEWIVRLALESRRRVKEQQKRCLKSECRNTRPLRLPAPRPDQQPHGRCWQKADDMERAPLLKGESREPTLALSTDAICAVRPSLMD